MGRTPLIGMARDSLSGPFDYAPISSSKETAWRRSAQGDRLERVDAEWNGMQGKKKAVKKRSQRPTKNSGSVCASSGGERGWSQEGFARSQPEPVLRQLDRARGKRRPSEHPAQAGQDPGREPFSVAQGRRALRSAALRAGLRQSGRNVFFLYPAFRFAQSGINPRPTSSQRASAPRKRASFRLRLRQA